MSAGHENFQIYKEIVTSHEDCMTGFNDFTKIVQKWV